MFALNLDALHIRYFCCIICIVVLHVKETMKINFLTLRNVSEAFLVSKNDPFLAKRNVGPREVQPHIFLTLRNGSEAFLVSKNDPFLVKRNVRVGKIQPEAVDQLSTLRSVNNYRESRNEASQGKRSATPPARGRTNPPQRKENFPGS